MQHFKGNFVGNKAVMLLLKALGVKSRRCVPALIMPFPMHKEENILKINQSSLP